jgi:hypothetical protein
MTSDADLHSTVANMWAVSSFVCKDAHKSELWKKVTKIQKLWTRRTGKEWLAQNRATKHLICCLILEVHFLITHHVRISNSLECRQAVRFGNTISPQAFSLANKQSDYVIEKNQEMISRMNLGCFRFEPAICRYFTMQDQTETAQQPQASNTRSANRARLEQGGNSNRSNQPAARPAEGRITDARPAAGARGGTPTRLSQDEVNALKQRGLL